MLSKQELIDYCLTYPGAYEDYPFDEEWTAMRHRQNKKTFAFIFTRNNLVSINLKCEPMMADFYRKAFGAVTPAYHMNKTHWNTITVDGSMDENEIFDMIRNSYMLIAPKQKK